MYRATPSPRRWDLRQRTSVSGRCGSKRARNSWWCRSPRPMPCAARCRPLSDGKDPERRRPQHGLCFLSERRVATAAIKRWRDSSFRSAAPFSKIPPPARRPPTSAHGVWRCSARCRFSCRFRRVNSWPAFHAVSRREPRGASFCRRRCARDRPRQHHSLTAAARRPPARQ